MGSFQRERLCFEFTLLDEKLNMFNELQKHRRYAPRELGKEFFGAQQHGLLSRVSSEYLRVGLVTLNPYKVHKLEYNFDQGADYYKNRISVKKGDFEAIEEGRGISDKVN